MFKNNSSQKETNVPNKLNILNTIEKKTNSSESTTKSQANEKENKSVVVQSANLVKVMAQQPSNNTSEKPVQNVTKTVSNIQNNGILARANDIKQKEVLSCLVNKTNQTSQSTVKNNASKDNEDIDKKSDSKGNNVIINNVKEEIKSNVDNKTVVTQSTNFKNNPFLNSQLKTPSNNTSHTLNKSPIVNQDSSKNNQPVLDKNKDNTSLLDTKKELPNSSKVISTNATKTENIVLSEKSNDNIKNTIFSSTPNTTKQVSFAKGFIEKNNNNLDNKNTESNNENKIKKEEPNNDFKSKLEGMAKIFSMRVMPVKLTKIPEETITTNSSITQEENVSKNEVNEVKNETENIDDILMRRTTKNLRVHKKTLLKF
jgi:hypothetical protein